MEDWQLIGIFFGVATLYSSVGFGGGSSYNALLVLAELGSGPIRFIALVCNLVVVSGNIVVQRQAGQFQGQKSLRLVLAGIPMAFLGGSIELAPDVFPIVLGSALLVATIMMMVPRKEREDKRYKDAPLWLELLLGGAVGFLAGLVGIGGGILLAPTLYLLRWDRNRVIASMASVYIWCNSLAGLAGVMYRGVPKFDLYLLGGLMLAVLLGGQLGARLSSKLLPAVYLRWATAALVGYVGVRLIFF